LFAARVTVVCVGDSGRPARIPAEVALRLQGRDLAPN
jgi:acyl-CoA thioesterase FadM